MPLPVEILCIIVALCAQVILRGSRSCLCVCVCMYVCTNDVVVFVRMCLMVLSLGRERKVAADLPSTLLRSAVRVRNRLRKSLESSLPIVNLYSQFPFPAIAPAGIVTATCFFVYNYSAQEELLRSLYGDRSSLISSLPYDIVIEVNFT